MGIGEAAATLGGLTAIIGLLTWFFFGHMASSAAQVEGKVQEIITVKGATHRTLFMPKENSAAPCT